MATRVYVARREENMSVVLQCLTFVAFPSCDAVGTCCCGPMLRIGVVQTIQLCSARGRQPGKLQTSLAVFE